MDRRSSFRFRHRPNPAPLLPGIGLVVSLLVASFAFGAWHRHAPASAQDSPRVVIQLPVVLRSAARQEMRRPAPLSPAEATARAATATATTAATDLPSPTAVPPTETATPAVSATPRDTAVPPTPTSTPTATSSPTPEAVCEDLLYNGGFDEGSSRWDIESTYRGRSLSGVIVRQDPMFLPQAVDGEWFARLGGGQNGGLDILSQPRAPDRPWPAVSPDVLVSATLRFSYAVFTELTRDRRPDDTLEVFLYDVDTERELTIQGGELSEESAPDVQWQAIELDVTRQMTGTRGEKLGLKIRSLMRELDDGLGTFHYVDAMSLEVCTKP